MKKALLIAATVALTGSSAMAQMADNSICPNWTGTDLNGVSYTLYDILDSGYTVFIDVSATWCGPCWNYHNTGALEGLYEQYGPGTAENAVRVFFIEGDGQTTNADLHGTGNDTQGDWVTGTPYPIIDNASIADMLEITYFPTIYKVCPNRLITEVGQKTTSQLWATVGSCQSATEPNDGYIIPFTGSLAACIGNEVTITAKLQNTGTSPLTSATLEARQGSTVLGTYNWTGNLDTYEIAEVPVATYTPSSSGTVTVEITSSDADATNNTQNIAVSASNAVAPGTNVTFEVKTDNYGSETTWKLFNPDGTIFSQGGPYTNTTSPQPHTYNWALDDLNCYRLEVYDAYGDGMCCSYGQGYYKVMVNGATVLQGGQFSSQDIKPFSTNAALSVGENNALDRSLNVYPNPSTGLVNVEYALEQGTPVQVTVTDVLGKTVLDRTLRPANGTQRETIDMGNLSNGIYLMKLTAGGLQAARTITLSK